MLISQRVDISTYYHVMICCDLLWSVVKATNMVYNVESMISIASSTSICLIIHHQTSTNIYNINNISWNVWDIYITLYNYLPISTYIILYLSIRFSQEKRSFGLDPPHFGFHLPQELGVLLFPTGDFRLMFILTEGKNHRISGFVIKIRCRKKKKKT